MASFDRIIRPEVAAELKARVPAREPRLFKLMRSHDPSKVSGTGLVAEGVEFSDGVVALRWLSGHPTTTIYNCIEDVVLIHGHGGASRIVYLDEEG